MSSAVLPSNATLWERAIADALSTSTQIDAAITAIRGIKLTNPPASFLPFLIWEYGLGELTPYVPNLYDLIDQGIAWQRVRGTPLSIEMGLGWLDYIAELEEAPTRRRYWNATQLRLSTLPAHDDLDRIDGVTKLSLPARSFFRRGVHYYDVPALEADAGRLDAGMLDYDSGLRVRTDGPLWSLGRPHEIDHTFAQAEGVALGNWIDPIEGGGVSWADLNISWADADFAWNADGASQRSASLAVWFLSQSLYVALKSASGVIGFRRVRACHTVQPEVEGSYHFDGADYSPAEGGTSLYVEAMTGFGDADNVEVTEVALVVGGVLESGVPSGRLWLLPSELIGGTEIATTNLAIPLRAEVREQIKFFVRF